MRHGKKHNHLGRTKSHRVAMLSNMACSLIKSKRITTTIAKAKALRIYVEPLITKSKNDNTHSRRVVFSYLQDKEALKELFGIVSEKVTERNGGYTRIIKLGTRLGDNAEMALMELVDFNENLVAETSTEGAGAKKSRRRRGGSKKTDYTVAAAAPVAEEVVAVEEAVTEVATEIVAEAEVVEEAPVADEPTVAEGTTPDDQSEEPKAS